MKTTVGDRENFESALRRFKRSVEDSGLLMELKDRMAYEKPSETRRKRLNSARRRNERNLKGQLPERLF